MLLMQFVSLCAVVLSSTAYAQSMESECNHTNPCPLKGGLPLVRCPVLVSKDGYLEVTLVVQLAIFKFEWLEIPRRSYGGLKCPPTWRVKPGDILNVTVINLLEEGTHVPGKDVTQNITNLHTHGLHISPLEPQDNVFVRINPGEFYQYLYKIADDQSPGTYWYHPHLQRATTIQTSGGMAGMLIVEDDPESAPSELRAVSCPENCEHDIALMLSPMLRISWILLGQNTFGDSLRLHPDLENWLKTNVDITTVNGEVKPAISLTRNQLTRIRILHVGFVSPLELDVVDEEGNAAPCDVREIARDGVYLDRPTAPRMGQSFMTIGNRLDWLIKCTKIGKFQLQSHGKEQHGVSIAIRFRLSTVIAIIQVNEMNEHTQTLDFPQRLPIRPEYLSDLRQVVPDQHIDVELGGDFTMNREKWTSPTYYRYKVEEDSVVEIHLTNTHDDFSHPVHFHINHAQVIAYEPYTGPIVQFALSDKHWEFRDSNAKLCDYQHKDYVEGALTREFDIVRSQKYERHYPRWAKNRNDSLGYHQTGQWLDTFYSNALSNMTLRMKIDKFSGPLVIHCHIPFDSDNGMIMVIEVVKKGGDLSGAHILSEGIAPGSCRKCDWNRYIDMPSDCPREDDRLPADEAVLNLLLTLLMIARDSNDFFLEQ